MAGSTLGNGMQGGETARRSAVAAADSDVLATFEAASGVNAESIREASTFTLWAVLDTGAATATVRPYYYDADDNFLFPGALATINALTNEDAATEFLSEKKTYPALGNTSVRLHLESISAGTLDLYMGTNP